MLTRAITPTPFASCEFLLDHEGGHLGICFGRKLVAVYSELSPQRLEVLDDAVVDDCEPARGVGMRVGLGRLSMRRPASMADPDRPLEGLGAKLGLKVLELALGAPARELSVLQRSDPGRVVTPVFKALQRVDNRARNWPRPQNTHNAAHWPINLPH